MPPSIKHPSSTPETSGKGRRYCTHSSTMRHARLDSNAETALRQCQECLANTGNHKDTVSISLIFRRAITLYRQHLDALMDDPDQFRGEGLMVRHYSALPGRPRTRDVQRAAKRRAERAEQRAGNA